MQFNRNNDQLPKLILFGSLFSALTASFVILFQEIIEWKLRRKTKMIDDVKQTKNDEHVINTNSQLLESSPPSSASKKSLTPEQRMYRLEKDGLSDLVPILL